MNYLKRLLIGRLGLTNGVFFFGIFGNILFINSGCCKNCLERIPTEEEKLRMKRERAEKFKNKIFIIEAADRGSYKAKFSSAFFKCVNSGEVFNKNYNLIKDLDVVSDGGVVQIIIPKSNVENSNYHYDESEGLFRINGEGVVVYFFFEDDKKKVYIYHKNIKDKLNILSSDSSDWYYEGYRYSRNNIDSSEVDFFAGSWVVSRAKYPSNDLMVITFHGEKNLE